MSENKEIKRCSTCKEEKPLDAFGKYKSREGGLHYRCKLCTNAMSMKWRDTTLYRRSEEFKAKERAKGRFSTAYKGATRKKTYYKYPEKVKARTRFRNAILAGKIQKQPCQECGEVKVHGHHYLGYEGDNAFKVQWLCYKHHYFAHYGK